MTQQNPDYEPSIQNNMSNQKTVRHLLGISGGKDSAALAIYMRDNILGIF
jgi:tRNA(Ile)-lysidine synthase TilS/MesJ